MSSRLRAKHGGEGCTGRNGTTFYTAADLCWVCWWNAALTAFAKFLHRPLDNA